MMTPEYDFLLLRMAGRPESIEELHQLRDSEDYMNAFFNVCKRYNLNCRFIYEFQDDIHQIQVSDTKGLSLTYNIMMNKYNRPMIDTAILHIIKAVDDTWELPQENDNILHFMRK